MELAELILRQRQFDNNHGWDSTRACDPRRIKLLANDVIGLVGEIGEFANILKKIQLLERFPSQMVDELDRRSPDLSEEIVDAFVYLIRICGHLNVDIEKVYLEKLQRNKLKYDRFEQKT